MDPENAGREAILKVTDWLRGIWEMRRKTGPVQQWVDSIPSPTKPGPDTRSETEENSTPPLTPVSARGESFVNPTMTISLPITVPNSPFIAKTRAYSPVAHNRLARDPSFQSDDSHCSSVESLLELRRADPEAVLLGLGFGGCPNNSQENGPLSRIPKRFLQPSKLQGITIDDFVKHEQETSESLDSTSLGYRGLTGSPYVAPSEIVQKIMERLREHESHEQDAYTLHNTDTEPYSPIFQDTSRLSVLSPDNRQFLDRPRSRSPDMRNKRMIIGQKSFAFGHDGDLIELDISSHRDSENSSTNGNVDNHAIDLEDKFIFDEASFNNNNEAMNPDENGTKSGTSKISTENRDSKEFPVGDCEQDLISPNGNYLPNELTERHANEMNIRRISGKSENLETRRDNNDEDLIFNDRRSSCDSGDVKKMPWAKLSRDAGRRNSESSLRPTRCLSNRRKSLKRQSRISDVEAVRYCEFDSFSNDEKIVQDESNVEHSGISENVELEGNETDRRFIASDRLGTIEVERPLESSMEKNSIHDVQMEAYGEASTNTVTTEDPSTNKKDKKRHGLSSILGMYNSAVNVRMEPGF